MPVLIEAISIVIRMEKILLNYPKGWRGFRLSAPNKTLCTDGEIARLGFMSPVDVESFVRHLESFGFVYIKDNMAMDLTVIDQNRGPAVRSDWIELGRIELEEHGKNSVLAARLSGSAIGGLAVPEGWDYRGSISETYTFVPSESVSKVLKFVRHENGLDVYENIHTGEIVYMGRSS